MQLELQGQTIPNEKIIDEDTTLVIVGLNFEPGARWQFMYNGFKISMIVKDDALMQKINEGERFGKGDAIKVNSVESNAITRTTERMKISRTKS